MKKIIDSGLIIVVITALIYSISTAYNSGFLYQLGIEPDMIVKTGHQVMYNGMMLIMLKVVFYISTYWITALVFIGIIVVFYAMIYDDISRKAKQKIRLLKAKVINNKNNFFSKFEYSIVYPIVKFSAKSFFIVLVPFMFIFALYFSEVEGRKEAEKLIEKINSHKLEKNKILTLSAVDKKYSIYPVSCGATKCVGVDVNSKEWVIFHDKTIIGKKIILEYYLEWEI